MRRTFAECEDRVPGAAVVSQMSLRPSASHSDSITQLIARQRGPVASPSVNRCALQQGWLRPDTILHERWPKSHLARRLIEEVFGLIGVPL